ncbi:MAG: Modification methylase HindIII [Candidatus Heimdallarchaeota archaeon LC_3]|nr:MAG: Modification methylase HindIII [Candidatus Heimdallarchaeota archaeon LC_3]
MNYKKRMNFLSGKDWIKNSISVWEEIKIPEENKMKHPAMFPYELCKKLINTFTFPNSIVLDPFSGSGSTLIASKRLARNAIGFEINEEYIKLNKERLESTVWASDFSFELKKKPKNPQLTKFFVSESGNIIEDKLDEKIENQESYIEHNLNINEIKSKIGFFNIHNVSCERIEDLIDDNSIDFVLTSPPYWDILHQRRTADYKDTRPYSIDDPDDYGNITNYEEFIKKIGYLFSIILKKLKHKKFLAIVVMDIRKKDKFYPFHSDLASELVKRGYSFEDIIIWNRAREYNNLRALGFPYVFRVNKTHEYILLFRKLSSN